jgi:hypothetical protein
VDEDDELPDEPPEEDLLLPLPPRAEINSAKSAKRRKYLRMN